MTTTATSLGEPRATDHLSAPFVEQASAAAVTAALGDLGRDRYGLARRRPIHGAPAGQPARPDRLDLPDAVAAARDQDYTWREIADALGISPTAARRRYRPD